MWHIILEYFCFLLCLKIIKTFSGFKSGSKIKVLLFQEWYDGCEYRCLYNDCNRVFFEAQVLIAHIKKQHGTSPTEYQEQFNQLETKVEWYSCLACSAKIKHQKSTIKKHVDSEHNMTIEKYSSLFLSSNVGKVLDLDNPDPSGDNTSDEDSNSADFDVWASGKCRFVCTVCLFESRRSDEFWKHVSESHKLGVSEYKAEHGDPCVERSKFECKICYKILRYDPCSIESHIKRAHDLNLQEYFDKFVKEKKRGKLRGPKSAQNKHRPGPKSKTKMKPKGKLAQIRKLMDDRMSSLRVPKKKNLDINNFTRYSILHLLMLSTAHCILISKVTFSENYLIKITK